jgi:hypothetical protein
MISRIPIAHSTHHPAQRPLTSRRGVLAAGAWLLIASAGVTACGDESSGQPAVPGTIARQLPTTIGDVSDICTTLPTFWRDPAYQALRRHRLVQTRLLAQQTLRTPRAQIVMTFQDADSGQPVHMRVTVRELAKQQLEHFDEARHCTRPGTTHNPTSSTARHAALDAVAELHAAISKTKR